MSEALQHAFDIAQQQPEAVQDMIAQLILEEINSEKRWDELLAHPKSSVLLEQLAEQAHREYTDGRTHDLDELL